MAFYIGYTNSNTNCYVGYWHHVRFTNYSDKGTFLGPYAHADISLLNPASKNYFLSLLDNSGRPVIMTTNGENQRVDFFLASKSGLESFADRSLKSGESTLVDVCLLKDYFELAVSAEYQLELNYRVYVVYGARTTVPRYVPLMLPLIKLNISLRGGDLRVFPSDN